MNTNARPIRAALLTIAAMTTISVAPAVAAPPVLPTPCPTYSGQLCVQTALADWSLDRIDQRTLPMDGRYSYNYTGSGVHVYVVDFGVDVTNADFEGRATWDYSLVVGGVHDQRTCSHATLVANIVGGRQLGVAKNARIHSVKIGSCDSAGNMIATAAEIVKGLDWVAHNAQRPAVANLSFGAQGTNAAVIDAVNRLIDSGVYVVTAAGQESVDACNVTPAKVPRAMTVGGTTSIDDAIGGSNFGTCIDLFAPGVYFGAAVGSSFAAPNVAGVAAQYLQRDGAMSQATLNQLLISTATKGALRTLPKSAPNLLLYSRVEPRPPVVV